jgi:hypothetical protein
MGKTYRRTNPNTLPFHKGPSDRPWDAGVDYKMVDKLPRRHSDCVLGTGTYVRANPKAVARQRQVILDENREVLVLKNWKCRQLLRGAKFKESMSRILQTWAAARDEEEEGDDDIGTTAKWHGLADLVDFWADGFAEVAANAASGPSLVSVSA